MPNKILLISAFTLFFISNTFPRTDTSQHPFLKHCLDSNKKETLNFILLIKKSLNTKTCKNTLEKLKKKKELIIYCGVACDIRPLESMTHLVSLELINGKMNNISYLRDMKQINKLNFYKNKIKNISVLLNMKNITWLNLNDNSIEQIDVIGTLSSIKILELANNSIKDVASLKTLKQIKYLDLSGNNIQDISPLKNLSNISILKISPNPIIKSSKKCPFGVGVAKAVDQFCRKYLNI